jgi:carbon storage regulator CsrA
MSHTFTRIILTRQLNESIQIGADITITVVRISRDKVRIETTAPDDMPVDRLEIAIQKASEGRHPGINARSISPADKRIDNEIAATIEESGF